MDEYFNAVRSAMANALPRVRVVSCRAGNMVSVRRILTRYAPGALYRTTTPIGISLEPIDISLDFRLNARFIDDPEFGYMLARIAMASASNADTSLKFNFILAYKLEMDTLFFGQCNFTWGHAYEVAPK